MRLHAFCCLPQGRPTAREAGKDESRMRKERQQAATGGNLTFDSQQKPRLKQRVNLVSVKLGLLPS